MTQFIKCLACKHGDPNLVPRSPLNSWTCNPSVQEAVTGEARGLLTDQTDLQVWLVLKMSITELTSQAKAQSKLMEA